MNHIILENTLKAHIRKRRVIESITSTVFLVVLIAFAVLYGKSRVVEEVDWGFIIHRTVTYNDDFLWGILLGSLGTILFGILLIADFVFSRFTTVEVNSDYITLYRGVLHTNLYVNGEYKDGMAIGYYLEATLSDRTKVNVALSKWSAHLTFTNGYPPVDI